MTAYGLGGRFRLFSRNAVDLTHAFPDVQAALADQSGSDQVYLDGELVVWADNRLDFGSLQQRVTAGPGRVVVTSIRLGR